MKTQILVSELQPQTPTHKVGDMVANFGQIAWVIGVDEERGLLLQELGKATRWYASPEKCAPVR